MHFRGHFAGTGVLCCSKGEPEAVQPPEQLAGEGPAAGGPPPASAVVAAAAGAAPAAADHPPALTAAAAARQQGLPAAARARARWWLRPAAAPAAAPRRAAGCLTAAQPASSAGPGSRRQWVGAADVHDSCDGWVCRPTSKARQNFTAARTRAAAGTCRCCCVLAAVCPSACAAWTARPAGTRCLIGGGGTCIRALGIAARSTAPETQT